MRGSKYIQSNKGDIYFQVLNDLNDGKRVLFSGTSCEVAGLKASLGQEYSNLLCVDIVCHGVPSPLVWKKYLEWQEQRTGKKCIKVDFRNKKEFGWRAHIETFTMNNGKKIHNEIFKNLFYGHWILRPSCYKCPFKDVVHPGDITIADYWGIEKAASEFDDNKGVSLVLINNERGKAVFEKIKEDMVYKETRIEDSMQPPLISPFPKPDDREIFWEDFYKKSFEYVAEKYAKTSWKRKLKNFLLWVKIKIF